MVVRCFNVVLYSLVASVLGFVEVPYLDSAENTHANPRDQVSYSLKVITSPLRHTNLFFSLLNLNEMSPSRKKQPN